MGSCSLLQGIFPTPGSNSGLPLCRRILYQLSHQGSPEILRVSHLFSATRERWQWTHTDATIQARKENAPRGKSEQKQLAARKQLHNPANSPGGSPKGEMGGCLVSPSQRGLHSASRGEGKVWLLSLQAGVDFPHNLASNANRRLAADGRWLSEAVQ